MTKAQFIYKISPLIYEFFPITIMGKHTCKNLIPMVVTRVMANSSKNHALSLWTGMEILAWFLVGGKYYSHDFCIPLDFLGIKDLKKNENRPKKFSKAIAKATAP